MMNSNEKSKMISFLTVLLIMIAMVGCFTTACQPKLEEETVIQSDNSEKIVNETSGEKKETPQVANISKYKVPEKVTENYFLDNSDIEVYINADVYMPNVDKFSIAEIEGEIFAQEKADRLRKYLTDNQQLYYEYEKTKKDYEEQITSFKAQIEQSEGEIGNEDDASVKNLVARLKELEALQNKAPEISSAKEINDYSIEVDNPLGFMGYSKNGKKLITIQPNSLAYFNGGWGLAQDEKISDSINVNEMINIAKEYLKNMDINGFEISEITPAYVYDCQIDTGIQNDSEKSYAVHFRLMRSYNNMMPKYLSSTTSREGETFDYRPPFHTETIEMIIDEKGELSYFLWNNPIQITGELEQSVDLLSFDKALDKLKQQLEYKVSFINSSSIKRISVKDIGLYLNVIPNKNDQTKFMYISCWYMTYSVHPNSEETIIINAVDGGSVATSSSGWSEIG